MCLVAWEHVPAAQRPDKQKRRTAPQGSYHPEAAKLVEPFEM
jgi:hypothetical protein